MEINQYEIVLVNLDPTVGFEIKKTRPCLVISPNEMNKYLQTIIVAPVTSNSRNYPTRVEFEQENVSGSIVLDQIRSIDRIRIIKKIDTINSNIIKKVKSTLKEMLVD